MLKEKRISTTMHRCLYRQRKPIDRFASVQGHTDSRQGKDHTNHIFLFFLLYLFLARFCTTMSRSRCPPTIWGSTLDSSQHKSAHCYHNPLRAFCVNLTLRPGCPYNKNTHFPIHLVQHNKQRTEASSSSVSLGEYFILCRIF